MYIRPLNYLYLPGRSGGQIAYGGTDSGDDLELHSTSHVTKGVVRIVDDFEAQSETTLKTTLTGPLRADAGLVSVDPWHLSGSVTAGITASTTQSQGQQPLVSNLNEVATVNNNGDVVTMPGALEGRMVFEANNGAKNLQTFPASGDNFEGLAVDSGTLTTVPGAHMWAWAQDATTWQYINNIVSGYPRITPAGNSWPLAVWQSRQRNKMSSIDREIDSSHVVNYVNDSVLGDGLEINGTHNWGVHCTINNSGTGPAYYIASIANGSNTDSFTAYDVINSTTWYVGLHESTGIFKISYSPGPGFSSAPLSSDNIFEINPNGIVSTNTTGAGYITFGLGAYSQLAAGHTEYMRMYDDGAAGYIVQGVTGAGVSHDILIQAHGGTQITVGNSATTITGLTYPSADGAAGEAVITNGAGTLSIGAATPAAHTHDGDTLQHDGVNSDGGAYSFTTTGMVTFNQDIQVSGNNIQDAGGAWLGSDGSGNTTVQGTLGCTGPFTVTQNSDTIVLSHDGTDAYVKWSDGTLNLQTSEGTNTKTYVDIHGNGTKNAYLRIYDQDDAEYLEIYSQSGIGWIETKGSSPKRNPAIHIQYDAQGGVYFFNNAADGESPEVRVYGFKSGGTKDALVLSVGTVADRVGSISGCTNGYTFDQVVTPAAADGAALGSAAKEWSDLYLADGAVIYGQNDQSNTLTSAATGWTANLLFTASAGVTIGGSNYSKFDSTGNFTQAGTARIDWSKKTANGATVTGCTTASAVADLQTANDGNTYTCTEVAATPNYLVVDFTSVTAFNWVQVLACYQGNATHNLVIQLEITPFDGSAWHTFDSIEHQTATGATMQNHSFFIPDDAAYINSGVVNIRILHSATESNGHTWDFDVVALYQ